MQTSVPDIFQFHDYRAYLKAAIAAKKQASPGFGLQRLAAKSGFRSAGMLSMIVSGKRNLTPASAERIATALALTGRRRAYLVGLAELGLAKALSDKVEVEDRLVQLRSRTEEATLSARQYRALAQWHYLAIYTLLETPGPHQDVQKLASRLRKPVSAAQVRQALADLVALGMVRETAQGWTSTSEALTTGEEITDQAVRRYHHNMIGLAREALEVPLELREMNGLTVALSPSDLPLVKERIRAFRKALNEELSGRTGTEVYQMNIQFFPLTRNEVAR